MHNFDCYSGKKVLVTGHTGFKGSWLSQWLVMLGANVIGVALKPNTDPSLFDLLKLSGHIDSRICDICDRATISEIVNEVKPDIVFHLAAQPLVRLSYSEPISTYETNVLGTLNVLEAARASVSVKAFVNITTDKCYENIEADYAYVESDKLGGYDMYSSSKACSEILTSSYRNSFLQVDGSMLLASARAGNVIGGGDRAQDRLIPDCIRALVKGEAIVIRSPSSIRPWQHVLEPLSGYLRLGQLLLDDRREIADCYNFGPNSDSVLTVKEVVERVIAIWGSGRMEIQSDPNNRLHEAKLLQLNINKSRSELEWASKLPINDALKMTVNIYKLIFEGCDIVESIKNQIIEYQKEEI